jgi:hypothetical protein
VIRLRTPVALVAASTLLLGGTAAAAAPVVPIPEGPAPQSPGFVGHPATSHPMRAPKPPQHPFMAANPGNNIHDDAYMTDTYAGTGPMGADPAVSSTFYGGECASVTFDAQGRLETVCVSAASVTLRLLDPVTLEELASYDLPPRRTDPGGGFNDFTGGGYFYLDQRDRAVVPTSTNHLFVVAQTPGPAFELARDYDLTGAIGTDDKIVSVIPDWKGRLVFVTKSGVVGAVQRASGDVRTVDLGETIANSFAVDDDGGVYVVTARAMYRLDVSRTGRPQVTWREKYANTKVQKPGQVSAGSGTTPTVMGRKWVSITDNADPMQVVVYRRGAGVRGDRQVCSIPVFDKGSSATENSLVGAGRRIIVTNNYGYTGPTATSEGGVTTPGIERVDIDKDGRGCHHVWSNAKRRSPSSVPKLALGSGLFYTVTKDPVPQDPTGTEDAWYLSAFDARSGKRVFGIRYGTGLGFNVNYAPVTIGPDRAAYVGTLGGLVRIADTR